MLPRMLSVMLIALAMLAAPLTMREGMAMASAPAAEMAMHHGETTAMPGHCDEPEDGQQNQAHKATGGNCCVATCVAVVVPASEAELPAYHPLTRRPSSDADRIGILVEIATPPPRLT